MTKRDEIREDYHEHPWFSRQVHRAVWVQTWVSGGTNEEEPPLDAPISCEICGRSYVN